ncbi:thiosulfate/3-mercaptopyruvate sulfurtransferase [Paenibacillus uliginis N3/975]|uniref:Thiosulfate/3-mercaptopyruvate sulfurtransferase n=1 Tax=Paenibacillus uliginis N3/975 TaxID=1313296 RepID=A0A1X7GX06_9BACL|nr:sulfurtransferase [Paenibacillus uliginis]SMF76007.1 thiosulfate/3-mercaptopyruvate sulfurtransferase [Paenibacillus uliginis N3/975]
MKYIVSMKWLLARMFEPDLVIVDCRFTLGQPETGRQGYKEGHIPRAVYLDLDKDLSSPLSSHGGRHPLPDMNVFAGKLGHAGIDKEKRVVIYDDQSGMVASRLWWMLKYTGHQNVYIMDQGFSAWKNASYPVTAETPVVIPVRYEPEIQQTMLVDVEDVIQAINNGSAYLIDSREQRRYEGVEEPIDPVAGHIPGAVNYFWKELLNEQGRWISIEEILQRFHDVPKDKDVIVYCGSGVSACPNVLALEEAGFTNVKLYGGSWSDWISYEDNPIATGEE